MAISRREVKNRLDDDNIEFLLAQFVDINGSPKVKMVPVASFDDIVDEGAGFAGAALDGMGQGPHSHDMLARPDLDSYTPLPWRDGVARFACDLFVDGEPHMYCPRQNMKRVLSEVRAAGYSFQVGIEPLATQGTDYLITHLGAEPAVEAAALNLSLLFSRQEHLHRLKHQVM